MKSDILELLNLQETKKKDRNMCGKPTDAQVVDESATLKGRFCQRSGQK